VSRFHCGVARQPDCWVAHTYKHSTIWYTKEYIKSIHVTYPTVKGILSWVIPRSMLRSFHPPFQFFTSLFIPKSSNSIYKCRNWRKTVCKWPSQRCIYIFSRQSMKGKKTNYFACAYPIGKAILLGKKEKKWAQGFSLFEMGHLYRQEIDPIALY
jgi:hypothetical protein